MSISAMKQALEALALVARSDEWLGCQTYEGQIATSAYEALRQAIEQEEKQEPLCWVYNMNDLTHDLKTINYGTVYGQPVEGMTPLYTAPPKSEWVGLTFTEYMEAIKGKEDIEDCWQAIEAKLKDKNHDSF